MYLVLPYVNAASPRCVFFFLSVPHELSCVSLGWQDQFDTVSDADLHSLDASIMALTAKVQGLQQSCRHMEAGKTGPLQAAVLWRSYMLTGWFLECNILL